jgi:hypothetical protein
VLIEATQQYADLAAALLEKGPPEVRIGVSGDATYAEIIAGVAIANPSHLIAPERLAWILAGIGCRETKLGTAKECDVKGPGCTGDFRRRRHVPGPRYTLLAYEPNCGPNEPDEHGRVWCLPADGRGYGRSEWQHDWDAHPEVVGAVLADGTIGWMNSRWACGQAALRFLTDLGALGDERQALAAFNCGVGGVRRALAAGFDVDANTTGRDYSRWVLDRMPALAAT